MKDFRRLFAGVIVFMALLLVGANILLLSSFGDESGRPYRVEISRLAKEIEKNGLKNVDLSECQYVTAVKEYTVDNTDSDYVIQEIEGVLYRFDYTTAETEYKRIIGIVNLFFGVMAVVVIGVLFFVREKILKPFEAIRDVPYELSRGNLTVPIKESKSRFFGKFIWGVDLLREHLEEQKQRELALQKENRTLVLSISHDIKTPLSAIKLYAKALSKGLYVEDGEEKRKEIAERINEKADEIEGFVSQIIKASSEDFLNLEVEIGEFYLSDLIRQIVGYYGEKLSLLKIGFSVEEYADCILKGDIDRSIEVLQNLVENAVKYGDGHGIKVVFSEEEECQLVTVRSGECTLSESELPHIFDSFWRGSNVGSNAGSGLGLYICRQLMRKMDGEVFAEVQDGEMWVTVVFRKM